MPSVVASYLRGDKPLPLKPLSSHRADHFPTGHYPTSVRVPSWTHFTLPKAQLGANYSQQPKGARPADGEAPSGRKQQSLKPADVGWLGINWRWESKVRCRTRVRQHLLASPALLLQALSWEIGEGMIQGVLRLVYG
ncbi:hypothetical protein GOP47_0000212 [Adiantum capillus-veneris]|uniref:Uncharacterized protein n=1 Tax=Adiantum capillus-veneris TaxID=13818 RepID=A0A9D4VD52_ADICA|nr:hypothetical protein GOP47_0000212 [Adiantum capillus-veneris]